MLSFFVTISDQTVWTGWKQPTAGYFELHLPDLVVKRVYDKKKTIQIELLFFLRKCASCFQLRQVLGHVTVYFVIKHFYKILCVKFCTRVLKSWKSIASRVAYKQYVFVFKRSILIYDVASFLGLSTFLSNLFCSFTSCRVSNLNATLQQL